jgi:hypothetical protein
MKFFHRTALTVAGIERLFKTAVLSCVERLFYCGMCPFVRRAEKINEAQKQDQSGILAQNIFVVRKTSAGFLSRIPIHYQSKRRVKCRLSNCRAECALAKAATNEQ